MPPPEQITTFKEVCEYVHIGACLIGHTCSISGISPTCWNDQSLFYYVRLLYYVAISVQYLLP